MNTTNSRPTPPTLEKASSWFHENPHRAHGVVLIWDGEMYGWKSALRDPGHERPGAFAIDAANRVWVATGGNENDGAAEWSEINTQT